MVRGAVVVGIVTAVLGAGVATACLCVAQTDADYRRQADVVFAGTVMAVTDPNPGPGLASINPITWTTFSVEQTAKGTTESNQVVSNGGSCGTAFISGHRYVVYASRVDGTLRTSLCSGTRELTPTEPPFALRRVGVYVYSSSRARQAFATERIGMARIGERPGPAALRLLLTPRFMRDNSVTTEIPAGTRVVSYRAASGTVRVTLSRRFATLSGRRLRRALAQVVLTVDATPGIERVRVRTELGALPGFDRPLATADFASYIAG